MGPLVIGTRTWASSRSPLVVLAVTLLGGVAVAVVDPSVLVACVVLNVVAIACALWLTRSSRPIDIFEPLTTFLVAWSAMFVLRPIAMLAYADMTLRGIFDVSSGLPWALLLSALGAAAFGVGYSLSAAHRLSSRFRDYIGPRELRVETANTIAVGCIVLAMGAGFASAANVATAYLSYLPLLAVPASLLLLGVKRSRWSLATVLAAGSLVVLLGQALAVGQRSIVLYVVGSLTVLYYLGRGRRPKASTVVIGGVIAFLVLVNGIEVLRETSGTGQPFNLNLVSASDFAPDAATKRVFAGGATEMLPAFALEVQTEGASWHFTPGYLFLSIVTHWIPGGMWQDKPLSSAELLYSRYFPSNYAVIKAGTAFSILGDYYFDSGTLGVFLGMFALGIASRIFGGLADAAGTSRAALLLYAPFIPLYVVLLRGDIALTLGIALYIYLPLIIAVASSKRREGSGTL